MEKDTDAFDTLELYKFEETKLYRASDTEGGGWNIYGSGDVRIFIIKECDPKGLDYRGWGQMTFHNNLTKAGGLNVLIVPNFTVSQSLDEPRRLTFKALSSTFGNNGKKNMYSMKLASPQDAARLWYALFVLQLAAKQAAAGSRIASPSPVSVEATVIRAFIGTDQDEVDRHLFRSRLAQLANANPAAFSLPDHVWSENFFAASITRNGVQELHRIAEDEHVLDGSSVPENESFEDDESSDDDKTISFESNSDCPESQDWFASFKPR